MKKTFKLSYYMLAVLAISILSRCNKDDADTDTDNPNKDAGMYPVQLSYTESGQNIPATVLTYTYDKDNHLISYQNKSETSVNNISSNQVDHITTAYDGTEVYYRYIYSYFYSMENSGVNIYTTSPEQVRGQLAKYEKLTGETSSYALDIWHFYNNASGLPTKAITSDSGGKNQNFVYDDKNNLKSVEYVYLTGPRTNTNRITVTSVDDKHSPFSQVKEYRVASYPHEFMRAYAWAYFQNNPIQMIEEIYDPSKNAYVPIEQLDYSYVYNEQGYPTKVTEDDKYLTGNKTHIVTVFNFTYKDK